MIEYFRKKWTNYKAEKTLFSKISDLVFVIFVIAMLIPSSRREVGAFIIRIVSMSPSTIDNAEQKSVSIADMQWQLVSIDGQKVQLADFEGKPIFINFWATWCPPCVAELPEIQDLYNVYHDKVAFVLVTDESIEVIQKFMQQKNYHLPIYFVQSAIPQKFVSSSIPTTYLISPAHKIVIEKTGAAKWNSNAMHNLIDEMIN